MQTFLYTIQFILVIGILIIVLMQPSKADGLKGFMTGSQETFFNKNKSKTREAKLVKITYLLAILFALNTILINILFRFSNLNKVFLFMEEIMIEKILKCIYIDDLKLNYKEMLKKLKSSNIKLFNKSLDKLKNDGVIFKDKDGRFVKSKKEDIYFGVYEGTRKGFGFLLLEEENDIFIPRTSLNGCMDRDTVIVRLIED